MLYREPRAVMRREIGESQVRTAAATETCFGLDTLLLQSLIAEARAATRSLLLVVPSRRLGRPSRDARSSRKASALAQPWAASDACRLRVDPAAARRED